MFRKCKDTYFILQNKYLRIYQDSFGAKILRDDSIAPLDGLKDFLPYLNDLDGCNSKILQIRVTYLILLAFLERESRSPRVPIFLAPLVFKMTQSATILLFQKCSRALLRLCRRGLSIIRLQISRAAEF